MHTLACPTHSPLRVLLFAGLLLLALPDGRASAQPADAPAQRIGLEEALQLALERNLNLQQSANDVALSSTTVAQERAAFYPNGSVGLSVSIPIFDRRQTKANVERAQVSAVNEQLSLEILEQEVAYDVQQALLDYQTAQAQLRAAERQLEAAQESLQAAEARYTVGASTLLEVTEARSVLVDAASGRLETLYTVLDSELAIAYQTGRIGEALMARIQ